MKRSLPIAALLLLLAAVPALAQAGAVTIQDNQFEPPTVTITAGDSVTWTHAGENPHSVTADDGSFDSSPDCSTTATEECMQNGDTFTQEFPLAGTFRYHCKIHGGPGGSGMSGTVVVEQAETTPAPTTAAPTTTAPGTGGTPLPETGAGPLPWGLGLAGLALGLGLAAVARRRATS